MCLIVRDKFDEEEGPCRHHRRRCDLPTELAPQATAIILSINHLHVVIPCKQEWEVW